MGGPSTEKYQAFERHVSDTIAEQAIADALAAMDAGAETSVVEGRTVLDALLDRQLG